MNVSLFLARSTKLFAYVALAAIAFGCEGRTTEPAPSGRPFLEIEFDGAGSGGDLVGHFISLRVYDDGTAEGECVRDYPVSGSREMSPRNRIDRITLDELSRLARSSEFQAAASEYARKAQPIDYAFTYTIRNSDDRGSKVISVDDYYKGMRTERIPKSVARVLDLSYELNAHLCSQLPDPKYDSLLN